MARMILSCLFLLISVPFGATTSVGLTTDTNAAASVVKSQHSPTTLIGQSLCPDQKLENAIISAVNQYPKNATAVASYIKDYLSNSSAFNNTEYSILAENLQQNSFWSTVSILNTSNYICKFPNYPNWYISVVAITNQCSNNDEDVIPVSSFVLEKGLPWDSSRLGAVQPQDKADNTDCQDSDLLSTIRSTINQSSNATSIANTLSDYMDTRYLKPKLCYFYMVQVIKNYFYISSYRHMNPKRFCILANQQWTISVISDTCSIPPNQITTTASIMTTPTATTKPTTPITSKPSSGNKHGVPSFVWSRPQEIRLHIGHSPQDDPLNFDAPCEEGSCSGHGSCKKLSRSPVRSKCACDDGFEGRHCERRETVISHRCYMRPGNSREKNQIHGIENCVEGQMCVPDNFYCFFYACPDSIGWCVKAHGAQAQKTLLMSSSDSSKMRGRTADDDDMWDK
uniref:EGF-like domain-containing protein n=1 Tax=Plectus sambesii TaxID=2011161 RepID=A0A914VYX3_9BILA